MSHSFPIVSVIIAFYNEQAFLREALESVIGQDYQNWEMILVDDGSSDESTAIAREYAERKEFRIIYAEHPGHLNRGLSPSRNLGLSRASGDYIAFLDADDVWEKEKLTNQVKIFELNPAATVLAEASTYWYSWNQKGKDRVKHIGVPGDKLYWPPQLAPQLYPLGDGVSPCPSGMLVKKAVFDAIGGFEEGFTGIYSLFEDQAFFFKIYLSQPVYVSRQNHIWYRQRKGSITHNSRINNNRNQVLEFFLRWAKNYLRMQSRERQIPADLQLLVRRYYQRVFLMNRWMATKTILKKLWIKKQSGEHQINFSSASEQIQ